MKFDFNNTDNQCFLACMLGMIFVFILLLGLGYTLY